MPRRTTRVSCKTNPRNHNNILKRTYLHARTPPPSSKSRNLQKPHPTALDRRMVFLTPRTRRGSQRNGTQRLPLRPHGSRPRPGGLDEGGVADQRGAASPLPLCPKETAQNMNLKILCSFRRLEELL
jgi:hypothetical protein